MHKPTSILGSNIFFNSKHSLETPAICWAAIVVEGTAGTDAGKLASAGTEGCNMGEARVAPRTDAVGAVRREGFTAGAGSTPATLQMNNTTKMKNANIINSAISKI